MSVTSRPSPVLPPPPPNVLQATQSPHIKRFARLSRCEGKVSRVGIFRLIRSRNFLCALALAACEEPTDKTLTAAGGCKAGANPGEAIPGKEPNPSPGPGAFYIIPHLRRAVSGGKALIAATAYFRNIAPDAPQAGAAMPVPTRSPACVTGRIPSTQPNRRPLSKQLRVARPNGRRAPPSRLQVYAYPARRRRTEAATSKVLEALPRSLAFVSESGW